MQTAKPIIKLIFILSLASIACLQTVTPTVSQPTPSSTHVLHTMPSHTAEPDSGAVYEIPTQAPLLCARVTAVQSLNLRDKPNEKANVIYWLPADKIIKVTERGADWWKVNADGKNGYARAAYLQESECE